MNVEALREMAAAARSELAEIDASLAELRARRAEAAAFVAACDRRLAILEGRPWQPAPRQAFGQRVTLKAAVLDILKATGAPLHVTDIIDSLGPYGVAPKGDPTEVVDSTLINAKARGAPVERVSPRVWRWIAESERGTS